MQYLIVFGSLNPCSGTRFEERFPIGSPLPQQINPGLLYWAHSDQLLSPKCVAVCAVTGIFDLLRPFQATGDVVFLCCQARSAMPFFWTAQGRGYCCPKIPKDFRKPEADLEKYASAVVISVQENLSWFPSPQKKSGCTHSSTYFFHHMAVKGKRELEKAGEPGDHWMVLLRPCFPHPMASGNQLSATSKFFSLNA